MILVVKSQPTYHVLSQNAWNSHIGRKVPELTFPKPSTLRRLHGVRLFISIQKALPSELYLEWRWIRDHPLLANAGHIFIRGKNFITGDLELIAKGVERLFGSMGPLENLSLDCCDLRPYPDAFLDTPLFPKATQPASFPPIKELAIIDPV